MPKARGRHIQWMRTAVQVAGQSGCKRARYGTLILDSGGRVVASGYNGKPAGSCNDDICYREGLQPDAKAAKCCLHSEQNALVFGDFSEYQGGTLYVTGFPCEDCSLLIAQSGIRILVCMEDPRGYDGLEVLERYGFVTTPTHTGKIDVLILSREEVLGENGEAILDPAALPVVG